MKKKIECPRCGSKDLYDSVSTLTLVYPPKIGSARMMYICKKCGYSFEKKPKVVK